MNPINQIQSKIFRENELSLLQHEMNVKSGKFVFTNGCFDILHKGHVEYLAKAAALGDFLVIGLNSDQSVREQNKGVERPINDLDARATLLAALGFVTFVIEFSDKTPLRLIKELRPQVLVKGDDYNAEVTDEANKSYIVGSKEVKEYGGEVKTIALTPGFSTTAILNKLK